MTVNQNEHTPRGWNDDQLDKKLFQLRMSPKITLIQYALAEILCAASREKCSGHDKTVVQRGVAVRIIKFEYLDEAEAIGWHYRNLRRITVGDTTWTGLHALIQAPERNIAIPGLKLQLDEGNRRTDTNRQKYTDRHVRLSFQS